MPRRKRASVPAPAAAAAATASAPNQQPSPAARRRSTKQAGDGGGGRKSTKKGERGGKRRGNSRSSAGSTTAAATAAAGKGAKTQSRRQSAATTAKKQKPSKRQPSKGEDGGSSEPQLSKGDDVLCFHGPAVYQAKILAAADTPEGTPIYKVHYAGWKKCHDEWVDVCRVLKPNAVTKAIQTQVNAAVGASPTVSPTRGGKSKKRRSSGGQAQKRAKLKQEKGTKAGIDEDEERELTVQVILPDDLKQRLVDDWDRINDNKLVELPAKPTVRDILDRFLKAMKGKETDKDIAALVAANLQEYFRQALPNILLYPAERQQFKQLRAAAPDDDLCDHYGGVHLLRLFVKLPVLLAHTDLNHDSMMFVLHCLKDMLRFLQRNVHSIIPHKYTDK